STRSSSAPCSPGPPLDWAAPRLGRRPGRRRPAKVAESPIHAVGQGNGIAEQVGLSVEGMTCATCAARIQKVLSRQPGVEAAIVNFAGNRASVTYRPDAVSLDQLSAVVERLGYHLTPLTLHRLALEDRNEL